MPFELEDFIRSYRIKLVPNKQYKWIEITLKCYGQSIKSESILLAVAAIYKCQELTSE